MRNTRIDVLLYKQPPEKLRSNRTVSFAAASESSEASWFFVYIFDSPDFLVFTYRPPADVYSFVGVGWLSTRTHSTLKPDGTLVRISDYFVLRRLYELSSNLFMTNGKRISFSESFRRPVNMEPVPWHKWNTIRCLPKSRHCKAWLLNSKENIRCPKCKSTAVTCNPLWVVWCGISEHTHQHKCMCLFNGPTTRAGAGECTEHEVTHF